MLENDFAAETGDIKVKGRQSVYGKAVKLMHSPKLKAFEIAEEPDAVKAAYGDTNFGKGCLMARRLVESGVRFVEVVLDGWDTHNDNFNRVTKQMTTYDPAMAALIKDLAAAQSAGQHADHLDGRVRTHPQDQCQRRPRSLPRRMERGSGGRRRTRRAGIRRDGRAEA